jgi:hypothetical protein
MKLGMHTMALEPVSTAYFINPSHQFVCLYMYLVRQPLGKHVPLATNARNNKNVGRVVFYEVRVLSEESMCVCVAPYCC